MGRRQADVLHAQVQIFSKPLQPFGAVTCFQEEHLSLIDSHAMFEDSVTEHHPEALSLNLSTVESFFSLEPYNNYLIQAARE